MEMTAAADLRDHGLRVTGPRIAALQVLAEVSHIPAETVAAGIRERTGTVSSQAVYNVLSDLTAAGLVHRIEPAGSAALYELKRADNHHHLVCRPCGRVVDLDCEHDAETCLVPPQTHGFALEEAEIVFWGVCPDCQDSAREGRAPTPERKQP